MKKFVILFFIKRKFCLNYLSLVFVYSISRNKRVLARFFCLISILSMNFIYSFCYLKQIVLASLIIPLSGAPSFGTAKVKTFFSLTRKKMKKIVFSAKWLIVRGLSLQISITNPPFIKFTTPNQLAFSLLSLFQITLPAFCGLQR